MAPPSAGLTRLGARRRLCGGPPRCRCANTPRRSASGNVSRPDRGSGAARKYPSTEAPCQTPDCGGAGCEWCSLRADRANHLNTPTRHPGHARQRLTVALTHLLPHAVNGTRDTSPDSMKALQTSLPHSSRSNPKACYNFSLPILSSWSHTLAISSTPPPLLHSASRSSASSLLIPT